MFSVLLIIIVLLMLLSGVSIYFTAKKATESEYLRLNSVVNTNTSESVGRAVVNACQLCQSISSNSSVIKNLATMSDSSKREIRSAIMKQISDYSSQNTNGRTYVDCNVLDLEGNEVSIYSKNSYSLDYINNTSDTERLFTGEIPYIVIPVGNYEGTGIMRNTFQVICPIKDLLSNELRGYTILSVSEHLLYVQYNDYQAEHDNIFIVAEDGTIISSKEKDLVGTSYYNTDLSKDLVMSEDIPNTSWKLVSIMDKDYVFGSLNTVYTVILLATLLTVIAAAFAISYISEKFNRRISNLQYAISKVMNQDFSVRIAVENNDEFGEIENAFNMMVEDIGKLITSVRENEHDKRIAEMDFLHAQINSHFIHNTLTSIRFLLEMGKTEQAGEMLIAFSKLLRQTLTRSREFIPLSEEIDGIRSYEVIQKYRYENAFSMDYEIAENTLNIPVPAIIIQPIVENSIFHGINHGFIKIKISTEIIDSNLNISVEDNGIGMTEEKVSQILHTESSRNHVGIKNINERLQMYYGKQYGVKLESTPDVGTKVTLVIPAAAEGIN